MKNIIIFTIFCFYIQNSFAQDNKAEMLKMVKDMRFMNLEMSFKSDSPLNSKVKNSTELPWIFAQKLDIELIKKNLDFESKNFNTDFSNNKLTLKSKFLSGFELKNNLFEFEIKSYLITNELSNKIEIKNNKPLPTFGFETISKQSDDGNGNMSQIDENFKTLELSINIQNSKKIKGNINLESKIISDFEFLKITKTDIGKEIIFNQEKYKVLSLDKGSIILQIINGNADFKNIVTNEADLEFSMLSVQKTKLTQTEYNFVLSNPNFTKEQYLQFAENYNFDPKTNPEPKNILVIKTNADFSNFYIYRPKTYISAISQININ